MNRFIKKSIEELENSLIILTVPGGQGSGIRIKEKMDYLKSNTKNTIKTRNKGLRSDKKNS